MNLAIHHFKKEVRCIQWRWYFWLGLLGLDLAVQLEWLLPMLGPENGQALYGWPHGPVLVTALMLTLVGCGEDKPSNEAAFIATRPLPRRSYFLARGLLVGLLFMLPLVLQEGAYLVLSGRSLQAIFTGMGWSVVVTGAWLLWAVPGAALWKAWWQALLGLLLPLVGLWLCDWAVTEALANQDWVREVGHFSQAAWVTVAWLGLGIWALLAVWHQRVALPLGRRLGVVLALTPLLYAGLVVWELGVQQPLLQDRARVAELAQAVQMQLPQEKLRPLLKATYQGRPATVFYGQLRPQHLPPQVEVQARLKKVTATMAGQPVPAHVTQDDAAPPPREKLDFSPGPVLHALPAGTVLMPSFGESHTIGGDPLEHELGRVENAVTEDRPGPLVLHSHFESTWYEWTSLADLPLEVGAQVRDAEVGLTITQLLPDTGAWVLAKPGAEPGTMTFDCRIHQSLADVGLQLVLHSPERRLAWGLGGYSAENEYRPQSRRATHTGWQRSLVRFSQKEVLRYVDGLPAAEVGKLRLLVMKRRYLGRSEWTWQSPPLDLQQHVPGARDWYFNTGSWTLEDPVKQLELRLAALTAPGPEATPDARRDYVLTVLRSFHALRSEAAKKAQFDLVVAKLRPFAQAHLDVLLDLPASAVAGPTSPIFRLANQLCNETHRDHVVSRIIEADWLAALVTAKGWSEVAREKMLPAVMAVPRHEKHLRTLMLSWQDPAVQQRQVEELRYFPDSKTFETLYAVPALRPRLDTVARALEAELQPLRGCAAYMRPRLEIAIAQGSAAALDMALPWIAALDPDDDLNDDNALFPFAQELAGHLGLELPVGGRQEISPPFRGLRAAQFDYQPALRAWRKKP
ncbi:MAG: glycosyltransferase family 87 protein [Verrucomicrobiota bacterium]